ncbi:MAG: hypothetical protein R3B57_07240 [Phycisphaerales bacterium]
MRRSWTSLVAAVGLMACAGLASQPGQPGEAPDGMAPPPPAEGMGADAPSPEQVRRRVQRRLDEIEAERERLQHALSALDDGRPAPEVMRELGPDAGRPMDWRGGPRRGGPGQDELAPEEDVPPPTPEEIRAFIDEHLPELAKNLNTVESMAPGGAERILKSLTPRIAEVIVAQRRDQKLGELKVDELQIGARVIEAMRRARELVDADGTLSEADENALRTSLIDLLTSQAKIRDGVRLREIDLLEEHAAAMRAEVQSHAEGRDEEIARLADRMIDRIKRGPGDLRERWRERRRPDTDD